MGMKKAVEVPFLGHPDKVCDLLVESIVDEYLRRDPFSSMDIQALGTSGMVMVGGVVTSQADFAVGDVVREAYATLGYEDTPEFFVNIEKPKPQHGRSETRGAQGTAIVYGYATNKTREMLPMPVVYARSIAARIDVLRMTDHRFSWLRPDGKVQIVFDDHRMTHVTVIASHAKEIEAHQVRQLLYTHVLEPLLGSFVEGVQVFINPSGPFTSGGFFLNAGVSGRKVLSDFYGGLLPHGGVALAGKDPLKPARSGTYMARYVARQFVREGLSDQVFVQVVYTAGVAEPLSLQVLGGDGRDLTTIATKRFDFRPEAIVERFYLRRPVYATMVSTGSVGISTLPWEADA